MPETVRNIRNIGSKMVILRLNDGSYVNIPAHGSCAVDSAMLTRNPAYDTLRKRGVIAVLEPQPEPEKTKPSKTERKKPAPRKAAVAGEEAAVAAAGDEMAKAPEMETKAEETHRADEKIPSPGGDKRRSPRRVARAKKEDKG